jgi:catechol 2,3-dioxygenase-like lactoylglutathione lyase family enzyme
VTNINSSVTFWRDVLGFLVLYDRPEVGFASLMRDGIEIMLDQIDGGRPERRRIWDTGPLQHPFGREINFELEVDDLDKSLEKIAAAGVRLFFGREERWYRAGNQ